MDYTLNDNNTVLKSSACTKGCKKLNLSDWMSDLPEVYASSDLVEVQFKNTRKGYFRNTNGLDLVKGEMVAVESSPGHDVGEITLQGPLVLLQMKRNRIRTPLNELKRIYRKVKPTDLEKFEEAKKKEHPTMLRAREIAEELKLEMKIGDVEYQGDGSKAIFYYIADGRVDFRELIKVFAEVFKVRIEMKQIGARQEAGRIGGIGPCGRELCCSSWMSSFNSVSTGTARVQDISLNPQKLAGQCAKLKCCINFEVDLYAEQSKKLPSRETRLETQDGMFYFFKADILSGEITYSSDPNIPANLTTIHRDRAWEIIQLNRKGDKPLSLSKEQVSTEPTREFRDAVGEDSLTRFDKKTKRKSKGRNGPKQGKMENPKVVVHSEGKANHPSVSKPVVMIKPPSIVKPK